MQLAACRLDIDRTGELLPKAIAAAEVVHAYSIQALGKTGCGRGRIETIMAQASRRVESINAAHSSLGTVTSA